MTGWGSPAGDGEQHPVGPASEAGPVPQPGGEAPASDPPLPPAVVGPPQRPSAWDLPHPAPPSGNWPSQPVAPQPWPAGQNPSPPNPVPYNPLPYNPYNPVPYAPTPGNPYQGPSAQNPYEPGPYATAGAWTGGPWGVARLGPPQAWQPRPYPQLLRGPTHRWWRPLVGLAIMAGLVIAVFIAFAITVAIISSLQPGLDLDGNGFDRWANGPAGMLITNLALAGFIPCAMCAVWWGHGWRPRWLASVAGGIRWRWLLIAGAIAIGFMAPVQIVLTAIDGSLVWHPAPDLWWLIAVVLLTTPLQAAGEEYLARGWLTQATGSLLPSRIAAGVVGGVLSGAVFALLHGVDQSFWLFSDRLVFGLVASGLAWWTGGLESGIVVHTANNYVVLILAATAGQMDSLDDSSASALAVLLDIGLLLVLAALLAWVARRLRLQRLFVPPPRP